MKGGSGMTLKDLEQMPDDFLTVATVASVMKKAPQVIRDQADRDARALGFPISKIGHSYSIPRLGFLAWAKYGTGVRVIYERIEENDKV